MDSSTTPFPNTMDARETARQNQQREIARQGQQRAIAASLQAISKRMEQTIRKAEQRATTPQPTQFDGVDGGFSGAVPRFRPLGSAGGVLGLPQASGALGVGATVGFVAGIGSATPRLDSSVGGVGAPDSPTRALINGAIAELIGQRLGLLVNSWNPSTFQPGQIGRIPGDICIVRPFSIDGDDFDFGTLFYWVPSTQDTQGYWMPIYQQASGVGAPDDHVEPIPAFVNGGTYVDRATKATYIARNGNAPNPGDWFLLSGVQVGADETAVTPRYPYDVFLKTGSPDTIYVANPSSWEALDLGTGGGSGIPSAALGIETTGYLAENTPTVLAYNTASGYEAWDNGGFWDSGNPTRITFASAGFYEITMHSPCRLYAANNSQTEWDCKVRVFNSSGVQRVTFDKVKSWYMLTVGGINELQYFDLSIPIQASAGDYITIEVEQRNSGTATLRFAASDYAWVMPKKLS